MSSTFPAVFNVFQTLYLSFSANLQIHISATTPIHQAPVVDSGHHISITTNNKYSSSHRKIGDQVLGLWIHLITNCLQLKMVDLSVSTELQKTCV